MKPMTFTVPVEISEQRLEDLVVLAVEDGGYGSFIMFDIVPSTTGLEYYKVPLTENGTIIFLDKYEEDSDDKFYLDRVAIQRGLTIMSKDYPHQFGLFINEADDAITGDVFLQCALLGEVVYG